MTTRTIDDDGIVHRHVPFQVLPAMDLAEANGLEPTKEELGELTADAG